MRGSLSRFWTEQPLGQHCGDDDAADRRALPERGDPQQVESVPDHHHDEDADQGADDRAATAVETGPANYDSRDGVQLQQAPREWVDRQNLRRQQRRRDSRQRSGSYIGQYAVEEYVEAGRPRRLLVRPDGVDGAAALRVTEI